MTLTRKKKNKTKQKKQKRGKFLENMVDDVA